MQISSEARCNTQNSKLWGISTTNRWFARFPKWEAQFLHPRQAKGETGSQQKLLRLNNVAGRSDIATTVELKQKRWFLYAFCFIYVIHWWTGPLPQRKCSKNFWTKIALDWTGEAQPQHDQSSNPLVNWWPIHVPHLLRKCRGLNPRIHRPHWLEDHPRRICWHCRCGPCEVVTWS